MSLLSRFEKYAVYLAPIFVLVAFLPSMLIGVKYTHDVLFHLSWFMSFIEELKNGVLYPRWLPTQFDGLGAPTLFFYPPFTNYFFSLIHFITFQAMPADKLLALSAFLMAGLSGFGFYVWIKNHTSRLVAIVAATAFAIAPYHVLIDYYDRGAFAEFAAYIWIPFVFAGIYHVAHGRLNWCAALSVSICGLFLTHLLTAVVIAPGAAIYALTLLKRDKILSADNLKTVGILAISGLIGVGMAAFYFTPALTMNDFVNFKALYWPIEGSYLHKAPGLPWEGSAIFLKKLFIIATIYLCFAAYLTLEIFAAWKEKPKGLLWTAIVFFTYAIMCGFLSFLFREPSPYREVQFVWRFLVLTEFSIIAAAAIMIRGAQGHKRQTRLAVISALMFLGMTGIQFANIAKKSYEDRDVKVMGHERIEMRISSPEYFPDGAHIATLIGERKEMARAIKKYTRADKQAFIQSGSGVIKSVSRRSSEFTINAGLKTDATIVLHQFFFPGWKASDETGREIGLRPETNNKLIGFDLPAGDHQVTIKRVITDQQKIGGIITLISLALLFAMALAAKRYRS